MIFPLLYGSKCHLTEVAGQLVYLRVAYCAERQESLQRPPEDFRQSCLEENWVCGPHSEI